MARIDSRGGTAMRDAIDMSMTYLKKEGHRQKKVLLVITDGNDNASNISLEKLVNRAQQNEVLVYSIGLLNEEERREARLAKRALDSITRDSGGLAFYPKGPSRGGRHRAAGGARNPQSVHHRLLTDSAGDGRQLPSDQSHSERSGASASAHPHRLLRNSRHVAEKSPEPLDQTVFSLRATTSTGDAGRVSRYRDVVPTRSLLYGHAAGSRYQSLYKTTQAVGRISANMTFFRDIYMSACVSGVYGSTGPKMTA